MITPLTKKIKRNLDSVLSSEYNEINEAEGRARMEFIRLFLTILLCTVGIPVLCGLFVGFCSFLFRKLCGRGVGYAAVLATSVIGTPVHELGHALMCLVFCHRIEAICLWDPKNKDGRLGYVEHSYHKRNPYAVIGNYFIGIGPLLSGGALVLLLLYLVFPETFHAYLSVAGSVPAGGAEVTELFGRLGTLVRDLYASSPLAWYWRIGALVLMFSVSLHVSLSPEDLGGAARAVPWLLVIIGAVSGVSVFLGSTVTAAVSHAMIRFASLTLVLFFSVLTCAILLVAAALVIFLVRLLFGGGGRADGM